MIIFKLKNQEVEEEVYFYCIGYMQGNTHMPVKTFETYAEARQELRYLNGGIIEGPGGRYEF